VIIIIAGILLYTAIRGLMNPFIALVGILFVTMVNPGELYPIFATLRVERVMVGIALLSLFVNKQKPLVTPVVTKRLLWFWGAMFLSVPFAFWPGGAFEFTINFGKTILYHYLVINTVTTWKRFHAIVVVFVALIGWIALGSLWAYANGSFDANALRNGLERAQGLTTSNGNPNALAMTMVSALPIIAIVFASGKAWERMLALLVVLAALISTVLTGSRTGVTTLVALVLVFVVTRKKGLFYVPVILVVALIGWQFVPQMYKNRYMEITGIVEGQKVDESFEARRLTRQAGLAMFLDNPVTGVGAGQFGVANGTHYWPGKGPKLWLNPHNLYLQLGAELGIIGIVAWIWFATAFFQEVFAVKREFKGRAYPALAGLFPYACLFCLFTLFLSGWSGHNLYRNLWYQLSALIAVLHRISTENVEELSSDGSPFKGIPPATPEAASSVAP
jgi:O-antigen ligase